MTNHIYSPLSSKTRPQMFFGDGHYVQEFLELDYPWALKSADRQNSQDWAFDEFNLKLDAQQLSSANNAVRHIFTTNLQSQIFADSIQGRGPAWLVPYITDASLEAAFIQWARFEVLHSRSYTHILTSMYPNPRIVLDMIEQKPEILARFSIAVDQYNIFFENPTKRNLVLLIAAINILEGLSFYSSFICNFSFAKQGMFESVSKYLQLIARDECLVGETEVLTPKGWQPIDKLSVGTKVAQMDVHTNQVSFVVPSRIVKTKTDRLYKFDGTYATQHVTPNHRMPVRSYQTGKTRFDLPENISNGPNYIPTGGYILSSKGSVSLVERFKIAVQADGHISDRYTGEYVGTRPITFSFSKERKQHRLVSLIEDLGFTYKVTPCQRLGENVKEQLRYTVNVPIDIILEEDWKDFSTWVDLSTASSEWCSSFIDELIHWDGYVPPQESTTYRYYSTTNKTNADIVQAIGHISGHSIVIRVQQDNRSEVFSDVYRLYIYTDKLERSYQTITKTVEEVSDVDVYCLTVPTGAFMVRHNDKVSITGNCLHLGITQQIIKAWSSGKDGPEWKALWEECKPEVRNMYVRGIEQEFEFSKYLFKYGTPIVGLNEEILNQCNIYYGNKRMRTIGLKPYNSLNKDPLPWVQSKYLSSSAVQDAPQEVSLNTYLKDSVIPLQDPTAISSLFDKVSKKYAIPI